VIMVGLVLNAAADLGADLIRVALPGNLPLIARLRQPMCRCSPQRELAPQGQG